MPGDFRDKLAWTVLGILSCVCTVLYSLSRRKKVTLQDKVVLITGASGGLGEAIAEIFFDAGCKVIISGRQTKSLEVVRDRLSKKMHTNSHVPAILVMDISDKNDVPERIKEALSIFGHIDILINNAGMGSRGWVYETELDVYEKVMQVNYHGQIYVTKALLPHMMKRKSGHIVAISSTQGKYGQPGRAPYAASKHAVEGFFDTLRAELSLYNIDVTTVCVTHISTNFSINAMDADGSGYNKMDKNTKKGMDPIYVAKQIRKSVVERKEEILIAPLYLNFAICLRVLAPHLFFKIMARSARKEAAQRKEPLHYGNL